MTVHRNNIQNTQKKNITEDNVRVTRMRWQWNSLKHEDKNIATTEDNVCNQNEMIMEQPKA